MELVGLLFTYWQEISVIIVIIGVFIRVNYRFNRNTERHTEAEERLKKSEENFNSKLEQLTETMSIRVGNHEDLCAERYKNINDNISRIGSSLDSHYKSQDKKISDIHDKINKVSQDVAYQSGLMKNDNAI